MNVVETEYHVLFVCPHYIDLLKEYLPVLFAKYTKV
jgi:hypothetical protein